MIAARSLGPRRRWMAPLAPLLAGVLALAAALPAWAGPWEARSSQGLTLTLLQSPVRNRDAFMIERRYPDKTPDASFAQAGVLVFRTGPDNEPPGAMRLDAADRIWVAGASAGAGDRMQAVVLRFLPNGAPDTGWAEAGRSATAPAGRQARAQDIVPLPDGGAWVAGQVQNAQGLEQAGWWRLRADGRVDPAFGLGGLWVDTNPGATEVLEIATGADGSAAVALRRGDGAAAQLELWVLAPGASAPEQRLSAPDQAAARLQFAAGRWGLVSATGVAVAAPQTAPTGPAPAPAAAPAEPRGANPAPGTTWPPAGAAAPVRSRSASAPDPAEDAGAAVGWWYAGLAGFVALGVGVFARRRAARR